LFPREHDLAINVIANLIVELDMPLEFVGRHFTTRIARALLDEQ
jgi:hypothetical protein